MEWKDAIQSKTYTERWYEVKCAGCALGATSDHRDTRSHKAIDNDVELDDFLGNLQKRGWEILKSGSVLCPKCCDTLVIQRVGDAFKEAIAAKAGEGK